MLRPELYRETIYQVFLKEDQNMSVAKETR